MTVTSRIPGADRAGIITLIASALACLVGVSSVWAQEAPTDSTMVIEFVAAPEPGPSRLSHRDPPGGGGRNPEVDFRGQRRRRETYVSTTDRQAQLYTKAVPSGAPGKTQP